VPADPQDHTHRAERNSITSATRSAAGRCPHRGAECLLPRARRTARGLCPRDRRTYRADLVQGLVDIGAHVGYPVLAARESMRTRRPNSRIARSREAPEHHQSVNLGLVMTSMTRAPAMFRCSSTRTKPRSRHHFQQRGVVGEARDRLTGSMSRKIRDCSSRCPNTARRMSAETRGRHRARCVAGRYPRRKTNTRRTEVCFNVQCKEVRGDRAVCTRIRKRAAGCCFSLFFFELRHDDWFAWRGSRRFRAHGADTQAAAPGF